MRLSSIKSSKRIAFRVQRLKIRRTADGQPTGNAPAIAAGEETVGRRSRSAIGIARESHPINCNLFQAGAALASGDSSSHQGVNPVCDI